MKPLLILMLVRGNKLMITACPLTLLNLYRCFVWSGDIIIAYENLHNAGNGT